MGFYSQGAVGCYVIRCCADLVSHDWTTGTNTVLVKHRTENFILHVVQSLPLKTVFFKQQVKKKPEQKDISMYFTK